MQYQNQTAEIFEPAPETRFEHGRRLVIRTLRERSGLGARYANLTLDDFKPTESQRAAFEAARQFCADFAARKNRGEGLLFAGNCGSGKTMLAAAMAGEIIEKSELDETRVGFAAMLGADQWNTSEVIVKFANVVDLLERLRCSFDKNDSEKGSAREILAGYERAPLLILDDLGAEKPSGWSGERLYELINYRYSELLPTIFTTNCRADEIQTRLGERLFDRIRSTCRYVPLTVPKSLR